jgi:DnaJ-class molecular chaperone
LLEVIECRPIRMVTLDGRKLTVSVDQVMSPGTVKAVSEEGLQVDEHTKEETGCDRGSLFVLFDVQFPKTLTRD